eukprot:TRINITY_DN16564_c0_g1_i6.p1 TRINITY_DN16564_c0_g1~~TRINITY_DN16564_c0_g1_i6.p1  ORF type:complete len:206 (-),score=56.78 TRINITY_DN16564_c0_g1_i6:13-630(-)
MQRGLVGSEMCIRDSINAEYMGTHKKVFARVLAKDYIKNLRSNALKTLEDQGVFRHPFDSAMYSHVVPWIYHTATEMYEEDNNMDLIYNSLVTETYQKILKGHSDALDEEKKKRERKRKEEEDKKEAERVEKERIEKEMEVKRVQEAFDSLKALVAVSYTHLTLPTILLVQISVVAVSLKKKKKIKSICVDQSIGIVQICSSGNR